MPLTIAHRAKSGATLNGTQYEASDAHTASLSVAVSEISATGTPGVSNFLRGDGSWSTGPRGATGARGVTGSAGANGANGTNGTNGSAGATGARGATGPSGQSTTFAQFLALGTI